LANPTTFSYPYCSSRLNIPKYEKNFRQSGEEGFGGVPRRFFPAVVPPLAAAHVKGSVVCSSNACLFGNASKNRRFCYQRCRRILESGVMRIRSLAELAGECGVSREYLCRLFHRFDTISPYQRLLRARINLATARLRQPGVLVKNVAAELGFSDPFISREPSRPASTSRHPVSPRDDPSSPAASIALTAGSSES
jgi:AraC-like DNA-binding protein